MIVRKTIHYEKDGSKGWTECIYDSSNILISVYFYKTNTLYIGFGRGMMYSYVNIENNIYKLFEEAESQGKFFNSKIKNNESYQYRKEFKLFNHEIDDAKKILNEWKERTE